MLRLRILVPLVLMSLTIAAGAGAQEAFTNRDVNLRAGPARDYPMVAALAPGTPVLVQGCLSDYRWCDVVVAGTRGWVYANFLSYPYQNRRVPVLGYGAAIGLPIVVFSIGSYWDNYYRGRPWYPRRDYWIHRPPPRPSRPPGPPPGDGFRPPGERPLPGIRPPGVRPPTVPPPPVVRPGSGQRPPGMRPGTGVRPPPDEGRPSPRPSQPGPPPPARPIRRPMPEGRPGGERSAPPRSRDSPG